MDFIHKRRIHGFAPAVFRVRFVEATPDTRASPASAREDDASSHFSAAQLENVVGGGGGANGLEKESRINLISRSRLSDEAASSSSLSLLSP